VAASEFIDKPAADFGLQQMHRDMIECRVVSKTMQSRDSKEVAMNSLAEEQAIAFLVGRYISKTLSAAHREVTLGGRLGY